MKWPKNICDDVENALAALAVLVCAVLCVLCSGCAYKGGKIVEGTDIAFGITVPSTEGVVQFDVFNMLTGFRFAFAEDSGIKCRYCTTNSVSAFGVYESTTVKAVEVELTPTIDEAETTEEETASPVE